jgi:hypothetical protein
LKKRYIAAMVAAGAIVGYRIVRRMEDSTESAPWRQVPSLGDFKRDGDDWGNPIYGKHKDDGDRRNLIGGVS